LTAIRVDERVADLSRKRKQKPLPPRRKRMNRQARLASARKWLMKFSGENVVRSYANWFGVDLLCAVKELSLCGVSVDPAYVAQLKTTFACRRSPRPKQPVADPQSVGYGVNWDENFAYIAGRTQVGFPYGITREDLEAEATGQERPTAPRMTSSDVIKHSTQPVPPSKTLSRSRLKAKRTESRT
jgi:hypothetical protein